MNSRLPSIGLLLALVTAFLWALQPILLVKIMQSLDPFTVTFFRFAIAGFCLCCYLLVRGNVYEVKLIRSSVTIMQLLTAGSLLAANYGLCIVGLSLTTPEATNIIMQLSPMLLLLAGIWVFDEPFSQVQWVGTGVMFVGLTMFFENRIDGFVSLDENYTLGVLLVTASAVSWVGYAILQKKLLAQFSSHQTMAIFFLIGGLIFLPLADTSSLVTLDESGFLLVVVAGLITLIAYICFAQSLIETDASRVSAVIALTPLVTLLAMQFVNIKGMDSEPITGSSIVGALLVVCGSVMVSALDRGS